MIIHEAYTSFGFIALFFSILGLYVGLIQAQKLGRIPNFKLMTLFYMMWSVAISLYNPQSRTLIAMIY